MTSSVALNPLCPPAVLFLLLLFQFTMAVLVLYVILPPGSRHICWIVSAGLAQVSEFSFVLSSRARRAGIISREVSFDDKTLFLTDAIQRETERELYRCV